MTQPVITGRSSSHFTRITRIFAAELGVDYSFKVLRELMSSHPEDYGGNPALKIPALQTSRGSWFGAQNICRELWRQSGRKLRVVWPEDHDVPVLANVQELVLQAMANEVMIVMDKVGGGGDSNTYQAKLKQALLNIMAWLEQNVPSALAALPPQRDVSFLEVTLFCLVTHLEFREVLPTAPYPELRKFCQRFAKRPSAEATSFRFDT